MLLRLNQMRRRHTLGVQVIGSKERSDSKDGYLRSQQSWWGVLLRRLKQGGWNDLYRGEDGREPRDHCPMNIRWRRCGCKLGMLVRPNLGLAAAHLRHLPAVAVHRPATSALLSVHRTTRHAGQQRRSGREHDQNRNESGESAHPSLNICLQDVFIPLLTFLCELRAFS
jgi:hypothetical protein